MEVSSRITVQTDLVAVNAGYHQQCNVNFRTNRNRPNAEVPGRKGAPVNEHLHESFLQLVDFLEKSDEPYSTSDVSKKFEELSDGGSYTVCHLKNKLLKHFGERIMFVGRDGLSDIVIMKETSKRMLIKSYEDKFSKNDVMVTAAKIVLNDVKSMPNNKDTYPSPNQLASVDFGLSFMPQSLKTFLGILFGQQKTDQVVKMLSIGHAIIQVCRPRCLLSPIQLGLGVQISVLTASRFLVDTLHSLGFCCSYSEVRKFKYCATISNHQIENEQLFPQSNVTKYAADNVDHNLCTLDGKGTFHGMGMISIESAIGNRSERRIPRMNATIDDIKKIDGVEIIHYSEDAEVNARVEYKKLTPRTIYDTFSKLDLLWTLSWSSAPDRPAWSGFMQLVSTGSCPPTSRITYLPMIDLSSSSSTCIYSTMMFIAKQALQHKTLAVLTFDQPLYWKARMISEQRSTNE